MEKTAGTFLVITGPTASGKSAFTTQLSHELDIEVVNCDVGQFYTPLSIGTAKPDLATVPVPHHLFDVLSTPMSFSAAAYRKQAFSCAQEIWARNKLPVFVGGSLFYVKSLFYPPQELENRSDNNRMELPEFDETVESEILWDKLYQIDQARALAINKNDRYRIVRALTLWSQTGRLPSSCAPLFSPIGHNGCVVAVTHAREALNARIDIRVTQMLDQGLSEEIAGLTPEWREFVCEKKLIGYFEFFSKKKNIKDVEAAIQQNTRAYAKRQMTFLRAFLGTMRTTEGVSVIDADLTLCNDYLYIEQIVAWARAQKMDKRVDKRIKGSE